uniref:Uncharacterized protein n=1 Tax=Cacopsylla melanoneura TaxID=428564 RepID=A0A8D8RGB8_9HEMI
MNQMKQLVRGFALFGRSSQSSLQDQTEKELQEYLKQMPKYKKIRDKMKHFQKDDGIPIYLKGGAMDKISLSLILMGTIGLFGYAQYWMIKEKLIGSVWYCESHQDDE